MEGSGQSTKTILICIGVVSVLMAVSPVVTFGDRILIEISMPHIIESIWSVFRSTGRLVWPVWYLIVIFCIKRIADCRIKLKNVSVSRVILIVCLGIQLFDIQGALRDRHKRFGSEVTYEYSNNVFWESLKEFRKFQHLCIAYTDRNLGSYIELAAIALKYDFTMNGFYFARDIDGMIDNFDILKHEVPESDSVYVFLPEQTQELEDNKHNLRYYYVGDYVIGLSWLDDKGNVNDFSYE